MLRFMAALAVATFALGCDPEPASIRVSGVRLTGDVVASHLTLGVTTLDAEGNQIATSGSVSVAILEGTAEVCRFPTWHGEVRGSPFVRSTSPCPPPAEGGPVREIEVVFEGDLRLTTRVPVPADAVWIDPTAVAAHRAEQVAAAAAPAPPRHTLEGLAADTFTAYAESIRRAVTAVPEQGTGEAAACLLLDPDPGQIIAPGSAPHGRAVYEPWARSIAAAEEIASPPPSPPVEEQPGVFVNDALLSTALAMLTRLTRDPTSFVDDQPRLARTHRLIVEDGPLLRIVRVDAYVLPVVRPIDEHRFGFEPGSVRATVFVVDREHGQLLCASQISAINRSQMSIRTEPGTATSTEEATGEVRGDLEMQIRAQIERVRTDARLPRAPVR